MHAPILPIHDSFDSCRAPSQGVLPKRACIFIDVGEFGLDPSGHVLIQLLPGHARSTHVSTLPCSLYANPNHSRKDLEKIRKIIITLGDEGRRTRRWMCPMVRISSFASRGHVL